MPNERVGSAQVIAGGSRIDHLLSLTLRNSAQEGTCSGTFVVSWPGAQAWGGGAVASGINAGVDGSIMLDGKLAAQIIIDTRISKCTPKSYELTFQFRGKMSKAVDSSPDHDTGQFNDQTPQQIIQKILPPGCSMMSKGGSADPLKRFIIADGETVERAARRCAREKGLNIFEDMAKGQWVLSELSQGGGGSELRAGRDFTQWSVKQDASPRFTKLQGFGNGIPTDEKYGKQVESLFEPLMKQFFGGGGAGRLLRIGIDSDQDQQSLKKRMDFEGEKRARQSVAATLRMSTWSAGGTGSLWQVGDKHHVVIPIDEVDDDLEIEEVEFELTKDTRAATIVLVGQGSGGGAEDVITPFMNRTVQPPPPEPEPQLLTPSVAPPED